MIARSTLKQACLDIADPIVRFALHRLPPRIADKRALWWGYRYKPAPAVATLRSGLKLHIPENGHLSLLAYYVGTFDNHSLAIMRQYLSPGATMLDVGANIGIFSMECARIVGQYGKIIAIEAVPDHADLVQKSTDRNNLPQIEVNAVAVGEADGTATISRPTGTHGGEFTLGTVDHDMAIEVKVRRIDDIVAGRKIDFIKMDIEGSEYHALRGAAKTISKFHPPILIELNDIALRRCGSSLRDLVELLRSYGYGDGFVIHPNNKLELLGSDLDSIGECECLFIHCP